MIARQFFWIKFVEEVGTGTNDMINHCREWHIPEPEFKHVTGDFVVTFFGKLTDEYYKDLGLNKRQRFVLDYLKSNLSIRSMNIQKKFDVTRDTANRDLNELIRLALIKREGIGKAVRYKLK